MVLVWGHFEKHGLKQTLRGAFESVAPWGVYTASSGIKNLNIYSFSHYKIIHFHCKKNFNTKAVSS